MSDYRNGKIYQISNTVNNIIYIGSTITHLDKRLWNHRSRAKDETRLSPLYIAMRELGSDKFSITLLKLFPCESKQELEIEELSVANQYDKTLLYNDYFGVVSDRTKEILSNMQKGVPRPQTRGENNPSFNQCNELSAVFKRGSLSYHVKNDCWMFTWQENKKQKGRSFSCKKYGALKAKQLAIDHQNLIFPIV